MKRSIIIACLFALAAAAWIASGEVMGERQAEPRKEPADLTELDAMQDVRVRRLQASPHVRWLTLRGASEADRRVLLRAETHGQVTALKVKKGVRVAEGDVIAELAPEDRPARLKEAEALRDQRRIEYEASRKLAEKGYRAQTNLAAARAALEAADAGVERALVEIGNLQIVAPYAGRIERRMVEIGDYLDNGDPVAELVDLDPIKIVAYANETQVGDLEEGITGEVRLVTGDTAEGRVTFIAAAAEAETRTFRVELEIPNADGAIPAGVTAEMSLPRQEIMAHYFSPAALTLADDGRVGVRTVTRTGQVRFMPVDIIDEDENGVWVSGLPREVAVIVVGQEYVEDGEAVIAHDAETNAVIEELSAQ